MEDIQRGLDRLEERKQSWRAYYEEEERRIEAEYQQGLIDIEEAYKKLLKRLSWTSVPGERRSKDSMAG